MMDSGTIWLWAFAIYFLVAFVWQFFAFKNHEDGKTVYSERTIVKRQLAIWLWPVVLPLCIVMYGVVILAIAVWWMLSLIFFIFAYI
jgi:hypothetical protein